MTKDAEIAEPISEEDRDFIQHALEHASPRPWTVGVYRPETREEALEWMASMHDAGELGLEYWNIAVPGDETDECVDMTEEQRIEAIQKNSLAVAVTGNGKHSDVNAYLIERAINCLPGYEAALRSRENQLQETKDSVERASRHLWSLYIRLRDGGYPLDLIAPVKNALFEFGDKVEEF